MRIKMQNENRNMKNELQVVQEQLEEEAEGRAEMQRQLTKAMGEAQEWRRRMESGEGKIRTDSDSLSNLKGTENLAIQKEGKLSNST